MGKRVAMDAALARLDDMDREELARLWIKHYGHPPPKGIGRQLLVLSAGYMIQAKLAGGDLKPRIRQHLMSGGEFRAPSPAPALKAGTRLVRVWNGRSHHVDIVEGGAVWNGETYRSLTAIAQAITGAKWSGPRFFGLVRRRATAETPGASHGTA